VSEANIFVIPKATDTHGDVFAAVGLADLLSNAADVDQVQITEAPTGFEIRASTTAGGLGSIEQSPGYPFLKTNPKVVVPKGVTDWMDYKLEKEKADRRKKLTQGKSRKSLAPEVERLLKQEEARGDWRLLQVLNTLQGDETSNRIHALIAGMKSDEFSQTIAAALEAIRDSCPSELDWPANSVQLFTPSAAKGYSRLKPDSTDRNDKTKEQWTDPFMEWLRYRGYFVVACPFFQGQKAENVRLICPIPHDLSLSGLKQVTDVENARRRELGKPAPRNVTTEEFEALVKLIDVHRASTVGPMLCAYGSCRLPREGEPEDQDAASETIGQQGT
jgi:hypothetical protein